MVFYTGLLLIGVAIYTQGLLLGMVGILFLTHSIILFGRKRRGYQWNIYYLVYGLP